MRQFCTNITKISNDIEHKLIKELSNNKFKYKQISQEHVNSILKKLNIDIKPEIVFSLNKSYVTQHIINNNNKNIKKYKKLIIQDYNSGKDIIDMSTKYDVSPLNLMREIVKQIYNAKLSTIYKNNLIMLSDKDKNMFNKAKDNDDYAQFNQLEILENSIEFEKKIQSILEKHNIEFKTQAELAEEQIKLYGHTKSTPDFLLITPIKINDVDINWIDAKNFYGSNTNYNKNNIYNQTRKYIKNYNSGCIIFSLGVNDNLNLDNILFMDFYSFKNIHKC